jgi:hypothetical protein
MALAMRRVLGETHYAKTDIVVAVVGGVVVAIRGTAITRIVDPGTATFCTACPALDNIPNQPIVAIIAGPLHPSILGNFEAVLVRKSPRIGGLGGSSPKYTASVAKYSQHILPKTLALLGLSTG